MGGNGLTAALPGLLLLLPRLEKVQVDCAWGPHGHTRADAYSPVHQGWNPLGIFGCPATSNMQCLHTVAFDCCLTTNVILPTVQVVECLSVTSCYLATCQRRLHTLSAPRAPVSARPASSCTSYGIGSTMLFPDRSSAWNPHVSPC